MNMNKIINIHKFKSFSLAFLMAAWWGVGITRECTGSELLQPDHNYSEKRLQELEAVYSSALEEIQWVLKNYPLVTENREEGETTRHEINGEADREGSSRKGYWRKRQGEGGWHGKGNREGNCLGRGDRIGCRGRWKGNREAGWRERKAAGNCEGRWRKEGCRRNWGEEK
jgi:hypothetical protein